MDVSNNDAQPSDTQKYDFPGATSSANDWLDTNLRDYISNSFICFVKYLEKLFPIAPRQFGEICHGPI
jgi:hypothetical protein